MSRAELLEHLTVEIIQNLSDEEVVEALIACGNENLLNDAANPRKRKKLGLGVLVSFCQRIEEIADLELNYQGLKVHETAQQLIHVLEEYFTQA